MLKSSTVEFISFTRPGVSFLFSSLIDALSFNLSFLYEPVCYLLTFPRYLRHYFHLWIPGRKENVTEMLCSGILSSYVPPSAATVAVNSQWMTALFFILFWALSPQKQMRLVFRLFVCFFLCFPLL